MLLNLHSYFSLRYGTLSPEDLLDGMLAGGYDTAVLTDINNSTGSLDFIKKGKEKGLNNGLYLLEGKVVLDFGCPALEVTRCGRMPLKPDPRSE